MLTGDAPTVGKARLLRRSMSLPEVMLWQALRQRPGGHRFRRQHPAGRYVLDFACVDRGLAIEVDGMSHDMGRNPHLDEVRDQWLANQGYSTMRISARDVMDNLEGVVQAIVMQCDSAPPLRRRFAPPPPRPGEDI